MDKDNDHIYRKIDEMFADADTELDRLRASERRLKELEKKHEDERKIRHRPRLRSILSALVYTGAGAAQNPYMTTACDEAVDVAVEEILEYFGWEYHE